MNFNKKTICRGLKRFPILLSICLVSGLGNLFSQSADSTNSNLKQIKFHLLTSLNPVINKWNDPQISGIFYGSAPYELQVQYKKNLFGGAYFRKQTSSQKFLNNGVKTVDDVLRHHFHLSYTREIIDHARWSVQAGAGYFFQRHDTANILYTSIENPYKNYVEREHGVSIILRWGYRINKIMGIFLETQLYGGFSNYRFEKVYPLTPSQNTKGQNQSFKHHLLLPSQLYFRVSLE